jgi:hypothetical protein
VVKLTTVGVTDALKFVGPAGTDIVPVTVVFLIIAIYVNPI